MSDTYIVTDPHGITYRSTETNKSVDAKADAEISDLSESAIEWLEAQGAIEPKEQVDMERMGRDDLNALAVAKGAENPEALPNKHAVIDVINMMEAESNA